MEREPLPETELSIMDQLVAEYLERLECGETPDIDQFAARAGEHAVEFRTMISDASAASAMLPRVLSEGTRIAGRYRIGEEIGQGGMGRVFRAFDENLRRDVAVKVLAGLSAGDPEREELLLKESRILAALDHPGIVNVHESGRDGEWVYLVMDLVDGPSLAEVIESARASLQRATGGLDLRPRRGDTLRDAIDRPLPAGRPDLIEERSWYRTVARILLEIARTIEAAHRAGIVHRDLKPSNVMLVGGGHPVVLDFGLAGSTEWATGEVTEGLYGTVAYLAPEQAEAQRVGTDPRTDVYQLGLSLYELLSLRRAFPGKSAFPVMDKIRQGDFQRPRNIDHECPVELEAICLMAMELTPEKRYEDAGRMREDLERFLGDGELPRAMAGYRGRRWLRALRLQLKRHPLVLGVAATALVGFGSFSLLKNSGATQPPITAWRAQASQPDAIHELHGVGDFVHVGDLLGVQVLSEEPATLFALSVFGDGELSQREVSALYPVLLDRLIDGEPPEAFGLTVEPGESQVVCSALNYAEGEAPPGYEGLMIVMATQELARYETWMEDVSRQTGITYGEALDLLTDPPKLRGGNPNSMSPAERKVFAPVVARLRAGGSVLKAPGAQLHQVHCQVRLP